MKESKKDWRDRPIFEISKIVNGELVFWTDKENETLIYCEKCGSNMTGEKSCSWCSR